MNSLEFKCVQELTQLVQKYGLIGIKTSFQDEGALFEETIRLKQICNQAKTKLSIKVGGPEAIRDIRDAITIGVKGLVAPMVQSSFGLKKFILAVNSNVTQDVVSSLQLYINIETITAVKNKESIFASSYMQNLYGITIGRVDLSSSLDKNRNFVDTDEMYELIRPICQLTKQRGLKICIGGAITMNSLPVLKKLYSDGLLDRFETRYAIFDPSITLKMLSMALHKAQIFENNWLINKKQYYLGLANRDSSRIQMIQTRIDKFKD